MSEEKAPAALTEHMVRLLLQMNPHLRGDGQTTKEVLELVRRDAARTIRRSPEERAAARAAAAPARDLDAALLQLSRRLAADSLTHKKEADAIEAVLEQCDEQERRARAQALELLTAAILEQDPGLSLRENALLLEQEKSFLGSIAFSLEQLFAEKRRRGR